jgi:hypothetical protein
VILRLFCSLRYGKEQAQKTDAEATVAIRLNQGTLKGTGGGVPFLKYIH